MDRPGLADFLRRSRARLEPADVGLAGGPRRRTQGLRREEVAALTGMSVDYYTRLEQARGPRPSRQMLGALARALRLTDDERDHLFHLTGEEPPRSGGTSGHVRPGLLLVLDRLHDVPAQVMSDHGDVLAQNAMSVALVGETRGENIVRRFFTHPAARDLFPAEDHDALARGHVAHLRSVSAARPDDPAVTKLVGELLTASEEFGRLWAEHEVRVRRASTKRFLHPVVGLLELDCETMLVSEQEQMLIVHSARPGTEAYERLRLLRGTRTPASLSPSGD
ncbi:helix-turn-helix transcriptional regulator [Streptomyces aurantiacus]|uniref:helix-turn-helix transcriptional regulator n=1 Tax=Streptomyces aurantiacus TaxID=47760 RepID=UPI0006E168AA|nr:helix-turn-helix transcriptional regulator [Streptomyces aurantiacus]